MEKYFVRLIEVYLPCINWMKRFLKMHLLYIHWSNSSKFTRRNLRKGFGESSLEIPDEFSEFSWRNLEDSVTNTWNNFKTNPWEHSWRNHWRKFSKNWGLPKKYYFSTYSSEEFFEETPGETLEQFYERFVEKIMKELLKKF